MQAACGQTGWLCLAHECWDALQEYPMFHTSDGRKVIENLDEFDDAREVVQGLAAEYQACERPDYVSLSWTWPAWLCLLQALLG